MTGVAQHHKERLGGAARFCAINPVTDLEGRTCASAPSRFALLSDVVVFTRIVYNTNDA